jgi:hypothetical protein
MIFEERSKPLLIPIPPKWRVVTASSPEMGSGVNPELKTKLRTTSKFSANRTADISAGSNLPRAVFTSGAKSIERKTF